MTSPLATNPATAESVEIAWCSGLALRGHSRQFVKRKVSKNAEAVIGKRNIRRGFDIYEQLNAF
ncbi:MAG: hypothetical protein WC071_11310 [Victivallaceae bacterium]